MLELLKKGPTNRFVPDIKPWQDDKERSSRVRCPQCKWKPTPSTVWMCESSGTPEPFFGGCGVMWNTFATGGRCPGCSHQWQWTSCPRCEQWSRHRDWYDDSD